MIISVKSAAFLLALFIPFYSESSFADTSDEVPPDAVTQTPLLRSVPDTPSAAKVRVLSFSPEISEIVASLDGYDNLVATDINSTYPEELKKLPKIADYYSVNLESLASLQFDYILLSRDFNGLIISKLTRYKNRLRIFSITDTDELLTGIGILGKLLNREERAEAVKEEIVTKIRELSEKHAGEPPIRTTIVIWDKPLLVVGGSTFLNNAVKLCGGVNIFENLPTKFPSVSAEKIITGKPEAVISLVDAPENLPKSLKTKTFVLTKEEQDSLMKVSPRSFDKGIPAICRALDSVRNQTGNKK